MHIQRCYMLVICAAIAPHLLATHTEQSTQNEQTTGQDSCTRKLQRCIGIADAIENGTFTRIPNRFRKDPHEFNTNQCVETIFDCFREQINREEVPYNHLYRDARELHNHIENGKMPNFAYGNDPYQYQFPSYQEAKRAADKKATVRQYGFGLPSEQYAHENDVKAMERGEVVSREQLRHIARKLTDHEKKLPQEQQRPLDQRYPKEPKAADPTATLGSHNTTSILSWIASIFRSQ